MSDSLTLPVFLADGSSLLIDSDFDKRLKFGDATVGWTGWAHTDGHPIGVYFVDGCVELRRFVGEDWHTIMRSKPHVRTLGTETLRFLADHDMLSRRDYDPIAEIEAANRRAEKAHKDRRSALHEEAADRLGHALRKDVGHHYGVTKREFVPLPAAPWKKESK